MWANKKCDSETCRRKPQAHGDDPRENVLEQNHTQEKWSSNQDVVYEFDAVVRTFRFENGVNCIFEAFEYFNGWCTWAETDESQLNTAGSEKITNDFYTELGDAVHGAVVTNNCCTLRYHNVVNPDFSPLRLNVAIISSALVSR